MTNLQILIDAIERQSLDDVAAALPAILTPLVNGGSGGTPTEITIADVTGLTGALTGKAATGHTHADASTTVAGFMSAADKTKLNGVATAATANDTNANLLNRGNHTGTQAISTVTNLQSTLDGKAVSGHTHADATTTVSGLMSGADKTKLNGVAAGATANDTNANLLNRSNHTGAQAVSTITGLQAIIDDLTARIVVLEQPV